MDRGKLYQQLFDSYKKCMVDKSTREAQDAAVKTWNELKAKYTEKVAFEQHVKDKIVNLETSAKKKKASLMNFWCSVPVKKDASNETSSIGTTTTIDQASLPAAEGKPLFIENLFRY